MTENKSPPRDYRQEVTNDIIRLLEEGTAPWQRPWETGKAGQLPYNPTTNKPYRGGNILSLMIASMRKGYDDPRFMTYKQAKEKGWQVRKGEKAQFVEYWEVKPAKESDDPNEKARPRFIHQVYPVFNAAQIDGIPSISIEPRKPFEVIEAGERILQESGADIRHGGTRAFYRPSADYIQLPHKENFIDAPAYYATGCHELGHWTGHEKRLNRETLTKSKGFDQHDEHYAREELVAELASLYLSAETGLPHDPAQHAAYLGSWLKALKQDKNEIFRAASQASAATDYVLGKKRAVEQPEPDGPHAERVTASREALPRYR
jgi:antirestriction protein ArdC